MTHPTAEQPECAVDADDRPSDLQHQPLHPNKSEKKRRRPPLACEQCRKRKIRCDRNSPCGHCIRARISSCTYAIAHIPAARGKKSSAAPVSSSSKVTSANEPSEPHRNIKPTEPDQLQHRSKDSFLYPTTLPISLASTSPSASSNTGSSSGSSSVEWLTARVHQLEEKLAKVVNISEPQDAVAPKPVGTTEVPIKGVISKTRYLGQSHWMNGIDLFPIEIQMLGREETDKGELYRLLARCKALGRKIKDKRFKPLSSNDLGKQIPNRELADQLVDNYFRTFEGVFRILHIPTFRADYERYWQNPDAANQFFIMQLQLCMALGATIQDRTFSLRATATQWVYEAQLWLILPPEKSRMTIPGLQISCLLVLAKSICAAGQDMAWASTGMLIRTAMHMGLHRDPRHLAKMSTYRAEMRRRLWATILEINMQLSFESGGQPLLSTANYDTQPPANLDDDQLTDDEDEENLQSQNMNVPTQTSVQCALLSTIPLRLTLITHINGFRSPESYDETLRLNSSLTKACRSMTQLLTLLATKSSKTSDPKVTSFHVAVAEIFLYRCFHPLHQPVVISHPDDPRFCFSRKMCLDSALKLAHTWGLSGDWSSSIATSPGNDLEDRDLRRLMVNGAGIFRNVATQAILIIATELIHRQNVPSTSLGYLPTIGGSDLRARLTSAQSWLLERLRSGETNIKGHFFISACLGHVGALKSGKSAEQTVELVRLASIESCESSWEVLKEVAVREGLSAAAWEDDMIGVDGIPVMEADWMQEWAWDNPAEMVWPQWNQGLSFFMDESIPLASNEF